MIKQIVIVCLLLSFIATIEAEPTATEILTDRCQDWMDVIKQGSFDKKLKQKNECREKAVPKDVLAAVKKCEDQLPLSTPEQVTKVCANIEGNIAKFEEVGKCVQQSLGKEHKDKLFECCKKPLEGQTKPTR